MTKAHKVVLSIAEIATRWDVSTETVRRMVADRHLFPGAFQVGRQWRVPLEDVEAYEAAQRREAHE